VSRVILKREKGNVTIFAFDEGQGLSEHTSAIVRSLLRFTLARKTPSNDFRRKIIPPGQIHSAEWVFHVLGEAVRIILCHGSAQFFRGGLGRSG
jgi:hypothetical protein